MTLVWQLSHLSVKISPNFTIEAKISLNIYTRFTMVRNRHQFKLKNLLVTGENLIILCDLGSAISAPNQDWSRTLLKG